MKDLKVVYMGTPDFSVPALEWLIENTNVVLVVTQPDKVVGRKREVSFSPVKKCAVANNIDVFQPEKIKNEFEIMSEVNPDIIITCAYGQIVPESILNIPKYGCINIHASLLPKYRGAAPIQWVLLKNEEKTGVTLMYMDKGMDTGDMIAKEEYLIKDSDTVGTLHDILSNIGVNLLKNNLKAIINGTVLREKQNNEDATYAPMIKREDEHIDFNDNGKNIIGKIRAFNPWPLANTVINDNEVKIINAYFEKSDNSKPGLITYTKKDMIIDCKDGKIYLKEIKPIGKKQMNIEAYLNGCKKEIDTYAR